MKSNILVLKLRNCTKSFALFFYIHISLHVGYVHKPYPILYESLRVEENKTRKISR